MSRQKETFLRDKNGLVKIKTGKDFYSLPAFILTLNLPDGNWFHIGSFFY
jgi:hypothetical protein